MGNNLDEVDDILSEGELGTSEMEASDLAEQSFNEAELEDIMAEIENLEKEFETEAQTTETLAKPKVALMKETVESIKPLNLQNEIDRELEMSLEIKDEVKEGMRTTVGSAPKVLSFEKNSPSSNMPSSNSEISFEAHGQMNLNLGFRMGDEHAKLSIDPVKGLVIIMSGVELCINQEEGCKVTMDSGVKFTIPLTPSSSALKKKSV